MTDADSSIDQTATCVDDQDADEIEYSHTEAMAKVMNELAEVIKVCFSLWWREHFVWLWSINDGTLGFPQITYVSTSIVVRPVLTLTYFDAFFVYITQCYPSRHNNVVSMLIQWSHINVEIWLYLKVVLTLWFQRWNVVEIRLWFQCWNLVEIRW